MQEWLQAQLASGMPAFAGTAIEGTVAIGQDAVNEWLARWVSGAMAPSGAPAIDVSGSARLLKHLAVRPEAGVLKVDFKIAV